MVFKQKCYAFAAVLMLGLAGTASATLVTVDVTGTSSCDGPGAACNQIATIDLGSIVGNAGSDVQLDALGWDLTIETVGASWLSEAVISFQAPAGTELFSLTAGVGDSFPGIANYQSNGDGSLVDLAAALGSAPLIAGGILTIEFYESFDDVSGADDAFYLADSSLTFDVSCLTNCAQPASEPGILLLFGLGLVGVVVARRRMV